MGFGLGALLDFVIIEKTQEVFDALEVVGIVVASRVLRVLLGCGRAQRVLANAHCDGRVEVFLHALDRVGLRVDAGEVDKRVVDTLCATGAKDDLKAVGPALDDAQHAARGAQLLGVYQGWVVGQDA